MSISIRPLRIVASPRSESALVASLHGSRLYISLGNDVATVMAPLRTLSRQ